MVMSVRRRSWELLQFAGQLEVVVTVGEVLGQMKREAGIWADLRAFPALAVIAALDVVGTVVLARKWSGGPPLHLTNTRLLIGALAAGALILGSRWWLSQTECEPPARWLRVLLAALCILPMLALLSLANSQHSPWIVSLASALAVASGTAVLWWHRFAPRSAEAASAPVLPFAPALPVLTTPTVREVPRSVTPGALETAGDSRDSTRGEWTKRTAGEAGEVTLEGQVVAEFAAGQSVAALHIPFSPAFSKVPAFTCEVAEEHSVSARKPAVYRYGARIELKRSGDTSKPARIEVHFRATEAAPNSSRAA
jgi:hypothetical protein